MTPTDRHRKQLALAAARLQGRVRITDCTRYDPHIWQKREDQQLGGSFKLRGVLNSVLAAPEEVIMRGIVCASSGNTAQAVCLAARDLGAPSFIFMTTEADERKVATIRRFATSVVVRKAPFSELARDAENFASENGLVFCSPGASWEFIYGSGTIGLEILDQLDVDAVYVPVGGGGLVSGVGIAMRASEQQNVPRVIGVQVDSSPFVYDYFTTGRRPLAMSATAAVSVADCLLGDLEDSAVVYEVGHQVIDEVVLVDDREIMAARAELQSRGIYVEPGAAAGLAAALKSSQSSGQSERVCVIVTGGERLEARCRLPKKSRHNET